MSRTDDIKNVAGHRLSTGAIEQVLSEHKSGAECAVIGIADKLKGQLPIGLLTLKAGVNQDNEIISKECIKMVRDKIGPVAAFKLAIVVKRLPKTRSGKILRGTVIKIADKAKLHGIICSPLEVKMIKKIAPSLKCFTPGIRQSHGNDDQKRTLNAKQAIAEGSDCLIIGRPITKGDPKKNIKNILSTLN